jgi:hypothetical protein
MTKLNQRQMDLLRFVAHGKVVNPGFLSSNVDERTLDALRRRGLVEYQTEIRENDANGRKPREGKAWVTEAGATVLRKES